MLKSTSADIVFVSSHAPKIPQDLEFLLHKTNSFPFPVVCSVIDAQMMSGCGKNVSDPLAPAARGPLFCSYHVLTSSVHLYK